MKRTIKLFTFVYCNGYLAHAKKILANRDRKALISLNNKIHDDWFNHETLLSLLHTVHMKCGDIKSQMIL